MSEIVVSIIMPTLNAGSVIEKSLKSIRMQSINQDLVEILVIDGGSTDNTLEIARKYNAVILENPLVVPSEAVIIGNKKAKGKYCIRMGADEEFTDPFQFERRIDLFREAPEIKNILTDRFITPEVFRGISDYYNAFGDPFSFFAYRMDGSNMLRALKRQKSKESTSGLVIYFKENDILPIGDGAASMLDLEFAREHFPEEIEKPEFVASYFQKMVNKTKCIGIVKGDTVNHYSSTKLKNYFKKVKYRIINNVHYVESSGYAAIAADNRKLNRRKYLYPLYCLIFLWPLWDALILSIQRKNVFNMMHFVFVYYTMFHIIKQYILKFLKIKPKKTAYGLK